MYLLLTYLSHVMNAIKVIHNVDVMTCDTEEKPNVHVVICKKNSEMMELTQRERETERERERERGRHTAQKKRERDT